MLPDLVHRLSQLALWLAALPLTHVAACRGQHNAASVKPLPVLVGEWAASGEAVAAVVGLNACFSVMLLLEGMQVLPGLARPVPSAS
jgi:hypothetical protein